MSSKDKANLLAILDAIDRVNQYTKVSARLRIFSKRPLCLMQAL